MYKYIVYGGDGLVAKSCPTLMTEWTVAWQAALSMEFFKQEYGSWLNFLLQVQSIYNTIYITYDIYNNKLLFINLKRFI